MLVDDGKDGRAVFVVHAARQQVRAARNFNACKRLHVSGVDEYRSLGTLGAESHDKGRPPRLVDERHAQTWLTTTQSVPAADSPRTVKLATSESEPHVR